MTVWPFARAAAELMFPRGRPAPAMTYHGARGRHPPPFRMILGTSRTGAGLRLSRETAAQAGKAQAGVALILVRNVAMPGCAPEASNYGYVPYGLVISPPLAAVVNVAWERLRGGSAPGKALIDGQARWAGLTGRSR